MDDVNPGFYDHAFDDDYDSGDSYVPCSNCGELWPKPTNACPSCLGK